MAHSSNFTEATLEDDGSLSVHGQTTPPAPGEPTLIRATVLREHEILPPVAVPNAGELGFAVTFPRPGKPFQPDEEIMVAGAAVFPDGERLVWSNEGTLSAPTTPAELFPPSPANS